MSVDTHATHPPLTRPVTGEVSVDTSLALYRIMSTVRRFELRAHDLRRQGLLQGTVRSGTGQEAVAAGVASAMRPDDHSFATYRSHHHLVARGTPLAPLMAELLGRENAPAPGRGGSTRLLGTPLVHVNDAAWAARYQGGDQVTVCFVGDGTTDGSALREALGFAVAWNLPVVLVRENGLSAQHTAVDRADTYDPPSVVIDGNDPDEVHLTARAAIERARAGGGPALIEAVTHHGAGGALPRTGRDPLVAHRARLTDRGVAAEHLDAVHAEVRDLVDAAAEEARGSGWPELSRLYTDVWSDGGRAWRRAPLTGRSVDAIPRPPAPSPGHGSTTPVRPLPPPTP
ncbi:thiamine pyrophosphate-dependent dehydrogenase E1 component subunit alpha [Streptomyces sp. NPDC002454]